MSKSLKELVNAMLHKSFTYHGQVYLINDIDESDGMFDLKTDKGPLRCTAQELKEFKQVMSIEKVDLQKSMKVELSDSREIVDLLKDTIQKVQKNKDYVPQAKEINTSIKNLIDLKRTHIDMMRVAMAFN